MNIETVLNKLSGVLLECKLTAVLVSTMLKQSDLHLG